VIAGVKQVEAYKAVYKSDKMSPNALAVEASRLMRHPQVSLKIAEGREKEIIEPTATYTQFTHQKAVELALHAAKRADELGQSGAYVSAVRLASDLQGYITEKKSVEVTTNPWSEIAELTGAGKRHLEEDEQHSGGSGSVH